jgi:hypothetical protein
VFIFTLSSCPFERCTIPQARKVTVSTRHFSKSIGQQALDSLQFVLPHPNPRRRELALGALTFLLGLEILDFETHQNSKPRFIKPLGASPPPTQILLRPSTPLASFFTLLYHRSGARCGHTFVFNLRISQQHTVQHTPRNEHSLKREADNS